MNSLIARSRLPYQATSATAAPSAPRDPVNAAVCHYFIDYSIRGTETEMQDSLLLAALALRAYRADHGSYPGDMGALVHGGYLTRVPSDPFSRTGGDPLRYHHQNGGTYLLYSIGPDGKDDRGTPITGRYGRKSDISLKVGAKGDFIVRPQKEFTTGRQAAQSLKGDG